MGRLLRPFSLLFLLSACGTGVPDEIPPALLQAIRDSRGGCPAKGYPDGPYGSDVGDTLRNLCFQGWRNPAASGFDAGEMKEIRFSDFHDPDGTRGIRLLLINTAALWCTACRTEWGGSPSRPSIGERLVEREDRGFRVLGTMFQDQNRKPAKPEHAEIWAESYDVDFPFVLDPDFQMGEIASETAQPLNMIVDAETMKILLEVTGDHPAVLWPAIDRFLDERAGKR